MFDYIQCEMHLPVRELAHFRLTNFQTKDLECKLHLYKIREDGRLVKIKRILETTPAASARQTSALSKILRLLWPQRHAESRSVEKAVQELETPSDFSGSIEFYDSYLNERVTFKATLEKGVVTELVSLDEKGSYQ